MSISEADATNRSRLIQAAADVFSTHGFEGASLRLIAEAADVSFQLITYYFGTKEKLWFEAFEYLHRRYLETGRGLAFLASGDINEQFRSHILLLLTDLVQRPQVRKIYIQEYLSGSDQFSSVIKKTIQNIANNHTLPYYREVVRLGIVKEYTAQEIGVLFSAIVNNNLVFPDYLEQLLGAPTGSPKSLELQADLLFRILTAQSYTGASETRASRSKDTRWVSREPSAAKAKHRGRSSSYPWTQDELAPAQQDDTTLEQLKSEIHQLKELVGDLSREVRTLKATQPASSATSDSEP